MDPVAGAVRAPALAAVLVRGHDLLIAAPAPVLTRDPAPEIVRKTAVPRDDQDLGRPLDVITPSHAVALCRTHAAGKTFHWQIKEVVFFFPLVCNCVVLISLSPGRVIAAQVRASRQIDDARGVKGRRR